MNIYWYFFFILIFLSSCTYISKKKLGEYIFMTSIVFVFFIGLRDIGGDTSGYIEWFKYNTGTLYDWADKGKHGYPEFGFYWISVIIKSFGDNATFYLIVISALTIFFLMKSLNYLCLYPILGFMVYYSRFLIARDMNQIRAALAIAIVMYALKFLIDGHKKKYIYWVLLAMTFHYSMIVALMFLFLYNKKFSLKQVLFLFLLSGIMGFYMGETIKYVMSNLGGVSFAGYVMAYKDLGFANPIIYYQCIICIIFWRYEKMLSTLQPGYYVLRNAYLFSIILLLLTANLGVIGGRLSTLFATCEIFIIPSLLKIKIRPQLVAYISIIGVLTFIFYMNFQKMLLSEDVWTYKISLF